MIPFRRFRWHCCVVIRKSADTFFVQFIRCSSLRKRLVHGTPTIFALDETNVFPLPGQNRVNPSSIPLVSPLGSNNSMRLFELCTKYTGSFRGICFDNFSEQLSSTKIELEKKKLIQMQDSYLRTSLFHAEIESK